MVARWGGRTRARPHQKRGRGRVGGGGYRASRWGKCLALTAVRILGSVYAVANGRFQFYHNNNGMSMQLDSFHGMGASKKRYTKARSILLDLGDDLALSRRDFLDPPFQFVMVVLGHVGGRHKQRSLCEKSVHGLQGEFGRLRHESPEENCVGEVTDDEEDVVTWSTNVLNGNGGDLADQGVESKTDHDTNTDTFTACACVEHFCRNNPCERATSRGETDVVDPGHKDESPPSADVAHLTSSWWEFVQEYSRNQEAKTVHDVSQDEWPTTTGPIDEQDTGKLGEKSEDTVNALVLECVRGRNSHLGEDIDGKVLNGGDTSKLTGRLDGTDEYQSAHAGPMAEQFTVTLGLVFVLKSNGILNLLVFGLNPYVGFVSVGMESGQSLEPFSATSVVDEPARGFGEQ